MMMILKCFGLLLVLSLMKIKLATIVEGDPKAPFL